MKHKILQKKSQIRIFRIREKKCDELITRQKFPLALETASGCEVEVDLLDWTQYDNETTKNSDNIDFILGSDITYHKSLIPPLCNVLRTMLEKK